MSDTPSHRKRRIIKKHDTDSNLGENDDTIYSDQSDKSPTDAKNKNSKDSIDDDNVVSNILPLRDTDVGINSKNENVTPNFSQRVISHISSILGIESGLDQKKDPNDLSDNFIDNDEQDSTSSFSSTSDAYSTRIKEERILYDKYKKKKEQWKQSKWTMIMLWITYAFNLYVIKIKYVFKKAKDNLFVVDAEALQSKYTRVGFNFKRFFIENKFYILMAFLLLIVTGHTLIQYSNSAFEKYSMNYIRDFMSTTEDSGLNDYKNSKISKPSSDTHYHDHRNNEDKTPPNFHQHIIDTNNDIENYKKKLGKNYSVSCIKSCLNFGISNQDVREKIEGECINTLILIKTIPLTIETLISDLYKLNRMGVSKSVKTGYVSIQSPIDDLLVWSELSMNEGNLFPLYHETPKDDDTLYIDHDQFNNKVKVEIHKNDNKNYYFIQSNTHAVTHDTRKTHFFFNNNMMSSIFSSQFCRKDMIIQYPNNDYTYLKNMLDLDISKSLYMHPTTISTSSSFLNDYKSIIIDKHSLFIYRYNSIKANILDMIYTKEIQDSDCKKDLGVSESPFQLSRTRPSINNDQDQNRVKEKWSSETNTKQKQIMWKKLDYYYNKNGYFDDTIWSPFFGFNNVYFIENMEKCFVKQSGKQASENVEVNEKNINRMKPNGKKNDNDRTMKNKNRDTSTTEIGGGGGGGGEGGEILNVVEDLSEWIFGKIEDTMDPFKWVASSNTNPNDENEEYHNENTMDNDGDGNVRMNTQSDSEEDDVKASQFSDGENYQGELNDNDQNGMWHGVSNMISNFIQTSSHYINAATSQHVKDIIDSKESVLRKTPLEIPSLILARNIMSVKYQSTYKTDSSSYVSKLAVLDSKREDILGDNMKLSNGIFLKTQKLIEKEWNIILQQQDISSTHNEKKQNRHNRLCMCGFHLKLIYPIVYLSSNKNDPNKNEKNIDFFTKPRVISRGEKVGKKSIKWEEEIYNYEFLNNVISKEWDHICANIDLINKTIDLPLIYRSCHFSNAFLKNNLIKSYFDSYYHKQQQEQSTFSPQEMKSKYESIYDNSGTKHESIIEYYFPEKTVGLENKKQQPKYKKKLKRTRDIFEIECIDYCTSTWSIMSESVYVDHHRTMIESKTDSRYGDSSKKIHSFVNADDTTKNMWKKMAN